MFLKGGFAAMGDACLPCANFEEADNKINTMRDTRHLRKSLVVLCPASANYLSVKG